MQNRTSGVHSLFECGAPLEELVPEHLAEGLVMMMMMMMVMMTMMMIGEEVQH